MNSKQDKAKTLTNWGNSMLNQLPAITRNRRKRDASKKRRLQSKREVTRALGENG